MMEGQLLFLRRTITKIKIAIVNKKTDNRKDSIGNIAVVMKPNNTILEGMRPKLNPSIQIQVVKLLRNVQ